MRLIPIRVWARFRALLSTSFLHITGEGGLLHLDTTSRRVSPFTWALLIVLPLIAACIALGIGRYSLTPVETLTVIYRRIAGLPISDANAAIVLFGIRLPRVLLALLVGAGLSAAGTAFQSLFANPLATPDTLGVASGASLGAVVGLFLGVSLISVQLLALAGGLLAVALTILVSRGGRSRGIITMVLSGMILGSLFSALISLFKYVADPESQLPSITYWLMGSLNTASYKNLILGAPFLIAGILMLALLRWRLNILPLSEDEARATGTNLPLLRGLTVVSATMITASAVSMCGQVGWVGLLIPHICRMLWGADNRRLIPASVSLGAVFMVIVDTLARTLTAAELPVSILTAVIGAPVFIALLRKTGGWQL